MDATNETSATAAAAPAPAVATTPAIALAQVRRRYPRLFRQYGYLSDREEGAADDLMEDLGIGPSAVDAETGLRTSIMMVSFAEPLKDQPGCPIKVSSDANQFGMFLWRMLSACESGSVGGDACRQFDALSAAADDVLAMKSTGERFEHLLGWTIAAANHQLYALLQRGDPDRNRSLFKSIADAWKKIFEANLDELVGKDMHSFANWQCEYFQKLLKQARKEYGDHARYSFLFIRKPRAPTSVTAASTATAVAAASASADPASDVVAANLAKVTGANQNENFIPPKATAYDGPRPWEEDGWIPMTQSGKQKTPNMIRGELQRYIDQCKADGTRTQTAIIKDMGVNNNTFRRFMNPKTYKNQWSAAQNGTYWAAARLLARVKAEGDWAKKTGAKRKSAAGGGNTQLKKTKLGGFPSKTSKAQVEDLISRINAVEGVSDAAVYDSCPQLVAKIKEFLQRDGVTKATLLRTLGTPDAPLNNNSLGRFLAGKGQDQCGTVTYRAAWVFFERLRILEGKAKSKARLKNELEQPGGFSLTKNRAGKYYWGFAGF